MEDLYAPANRLDPWVADFRRIGLHGLKGKLEMANPRWKPATGRGDQAAYDDLMQLRNALARGNERQLDRLRTQPVPVPDTLGWTRARLPGLNRTARALDKLVWDHLSATLKRNRGERPVEAATSRIRRRGLNWSHGASSIRHGSTEEHGHGRR